MAHKHKRTDDEEEDGGEEHLDRSVKRLRLSGWEQQQGKQPPGGQPSASSSEGSETSQSTPMQTEEGAMSYMNALLRSMHFLRLARRETKASQPPP